MDPSLFKQAFRNMWKEMDMPDGIAFSDDWGMFLMGGEL